MAITLEQAKVGMADKVDQAVVDTFRRSSLLLDKLTFDNTISPGTGGSTLTYGYMQLQNPTVAYCRSIGEEYTPDEAKKTLKTAKATILGGAFQVDRVLQNTSGAADEIQFQAEEKIKATANRFHNMVINGEPVANVEGLRDMLSGTVNELTSKVKLITSEDMANNYNAFLDEMDDFISHVDGTPDLLMMNGRMLTKLRSIARRAGYYDRSRDDFGNVVETYAGIPMVDMGPYRDAEDVIEVGGGKTAIYAVCLGLDGFHGISPTGTGVIHSYMPDMSAPGAVKTGEVELVAGVVLKNTKKAAVLKDIQIASVE